MIMTLSYADPELMGEFEVMKKWSTKNAHLQPKNFQNLSSKVDRVVKAGSCVMEEVSMFK